MRPRFHLAFPVQDLDAARAFYVGLLGCAVGRESARWIDFDFQGHQITAHLVESLEETAANPVDGDRVPARHFGLILERPDWDALAARLRDAGTPFLIEPRVRFPRGVPGSRRRCSSATPRAMRWNSSPSQTSDRFSRWIRAWADRGLQESAGEPARPPAQPSASQISVTASTRITIQVNRVP